MDHGGNNTQPWKHLDGEPPRLELPYSPGLEKCDIRKVPQKFCTPREEQGQDHRMAWLGKDLERSSGSEAPDMDQLTGPGKAVTDWTD